MFYVFYTKLTVKKGRNIHDNSSHILRHQLLNKRTMPVTVTLVRERRSPLRAPWVYRSLSISLSIFRIIIQVTIPNFSGFTRSSPAP